MFSVQAYLKQLDITFMVCLNAVNGVAYCTAQKMKFSIKDFFSKCDQIRSFLWIWSNWLKKSLMENFIFCAVLRTSFQNDFL